MNLTPGENSIDTLFEAFGGVIKALQESADNQFKMYGDNTSILNFENHQLLMEDINAIISYKENNVERMEQPLMNCQNRAEAYESDARIHKGWQMATTGALLLLSGAGALDTAAKASLLLLKTAGYVFGGAALAFGEAELFEGTQYTMYGYSGDGHSDTVNPLKDVLGEESYQDLMTASLVGTNVVSIAGTIGEVMATVKSVKALKGSPKAEPVKVLEESPTAKPAKPVKAVEGSPTAKPAKAVEGSPKAKPAKSIEGSPTEKPAKALDGSPTAKPAKPLDGSPTAKPAKVTEGSPTAKPAKVTDGSSTAKPAKPVDGKPTTKPVKVTDGSPTAKPAKVTEGSPTAKPAKVTEGSPKAEPVEVIEERPPITSETIKGGKYSDAVFASQDKLISHYDKHGAEFKGLYNSADEYLQGARDVMNTGYKVEYSYKGETRIGFVQFMGNNSKGKAKFAFVGTNNEGYITTFHTESGKTFWKMLNNGENIPVINPK